jgi:hypothetical protein
MTFRQTLLGEVERERAPAAPAPSSDRDLSLGRGEVGGDHSLDLRRAYAPLEPADRAAVLDEDERRDLGDLQTLCPVRLRFSVDAGDPQPGALLAREVREQALHAPRWAGA